MNEPILDKGTELQGLSTGVLFPSIDLFGGPVRKAVGPLTPIVGVSLFLRTVLTLQRAGIRQLIVLSGPEEEQLKQALLKLKDQERIVLTLYYFEELKLHEIAEVLELTESRVSQIRSKALARLRTDLAPHRAGGM